MVRARRILEIIEENGLIARARTPGETLLHELHDLAKRHDSVTEPRGRGLMCAITLPTAQFRDDVVRRMRDDENTLVLACGATSLRVRPALTITEDDLRRGLAALDRVLTGLS